MSIITYLTTIRFESGAVSALAGELARLGIERPLVVTDRGLMASGLVERVAAGLSTAAIFAETPSNPTEAAVLAALDMYRRGGHDGIVAIGGGSSIDLAKGVALLATHTEPLVRYAAIEGGIERIGPVAPLVAVPTTAGTGSEVGRAALITLADGRKVGLISPHLIPRLALCDPELTLGLPPTLTAATGMDAITHCIETYLSPRYNPPADAIALDGLRRGIAYIETAVTEPGNLTARSEMLMSALQGGLTFQKGLGAVHGLSHALGSLTAVSMHHGMLNAILLPAVLRFNESAVAPERWHALREAMSCPAGTHPADHIAALVVRLGLPARLSQLGYSSTHDDEIVDKAMQDHSTATNPRQLDAPAYRAILAEAM
jgi:4-hydroxybutyrate dehydrogenase